MLRSASHARSMVFVPRIAKLGQGHFWVLLFVMLLMSLRGLWQAYPRISRMCIPRMSCIPCPLIFCILMKAHRTACLNVLGLHRKPSIYFVIIRNPTCHLTSWTGNASVTRQDLLMSLALKANFVCSKKLQNRNLKRILNGDSLRLSFYFID